MGRGHAIGYGPMQLSWIKQHANLPRREAHKQFCTLFDRHDVSLDNFKSLCTRNGWATGRTGCYEKGSVPENKGKKMPYNANSARTQFKKGERTGRAHLNYKPIGFERVTVDGYIERKINDDLPFNKRWRPVHVLNWEAVNGPVPKGHFLKCMDGNKANTDPLNWTCLSRAVQTYMNGGHASHGINFEKASPEVRASIIALAKLKAGLKARKRKESRSA